ncbi:dethiobiotin synthase [Plasticicumulans acidivorans]|uniref:ATP-dependent dethiobiotin synthetase BioD n=1 Tax=Plasticicumulans acidivorans TaxID=886464 RepID=A0A317MV38_9GAMM|nr:dethiobiotin synthase [Plasticicumulans acidivorans]PWV61787.1 dethiobiotin synthase [Plasticicumulans acidivorans]
MNRHGCFVTGTDTGVGKTWVSTALLLALAARGVRAVGMKPVASGCEPTADGLRNEDALALQAASAGAPDYALVNPYAFAPAIAPHLAARDVGVDIGFERIVERAGQLTAGGEFLLVEGAGGWRVPLGRDGDMAALACRLDLPVVLVVGLRLGCINHALLSAESIRAAGLRLAGWVGNTIEPQMPRLADNLATLHASLPEPCLGVLPYSLGAVRPDSFAALDVTCLLA